MLSKNDWVRPIFLFFGFAREKSFVTVAFDRPVYGAQHQKAEASSPCVEIRYLLNGDGWRVKYKIQ